MYALALTEACCLIKTNDCVRRIAVGEVRFAATYRSERAGYCECTVRKGRHYWESKDGRHF